jgi:hypothetical protein
MQHYVTDMVSRQIDHKLNFVRRNQMTVLGGRQRHQTVANQVRRAADGDHTADDDNDEDDDEDVDARPKDKIYLPSSVHGSPRHRRRMAANALNLVSARGATTAFITGTTNVDWPEIQSQLFEGQTAYDRPDVVTQVFKSRLQRFIHELKRG